MKAGEPDLEKEQELRMVKHLEGQAGADPSLKQVMLWNCLVQMLLWHWALAAPGTGHLPPLPLDLRFLPVDSQSWHHSALLLNHFSPIPAF